MKKFFIPCKENNYQPLLLSKVALYIYLILLLFTNLGFEFITPAKVIANVNITNLYEYHNQERERLGLSMLKINTQLIDSATQKAEAMLASDCWSHYCPDGKSPWDFFDSAGYVYIYAGENLAEGFTKTDELMQAWMNSPTHRANIVNENFDEIGIGYVKGRYQDKDDNMIIVVHFGSRNKVPQLPETGSYNDVSLVKITSISNNQYLNTDSVNISGTAPDNSKLKLNLNQDLIVETTSTNNNFSYTIDNLSEGRYSLYIEAYSTNGSFLGSSRNLYFTVDLTPPQKNFENIYISSLIYNSSDYYAEIISSEKDIDIIKIPKLAISSIHMGDNPTIKLSVNQLENYQLSGLDFEIYDKAGNMTEVEVPVEYLKRAVKANLEKIGSDQNISSEYSDIKTNFNWGFITFLTTLFGIDFVYLSKTGMTNKEKSKSHLNLIILVILLLIIVIGASSGKIIDGILK